MSFLVDQYQNLQKFEKKKVEKIGLGSSKVVFSDFNSIIFWHESEDINKKSYKISGDSNFKFSSYAWLLCVSSLP